MFSSNHLCSINRRYDYGGFGNDLLSQAELKIKHDSIIIKKLHEEGVLGTMFSPSYVVEGNMPNTAHIICEKKRKEVERLIEDYQLRKIKSANIEMTITVNEQQKMLQGLDVYLFRKEK